MILKNISQSNENILREGISPNPFYFQYWVNSKTYWALYPCHGNLSRRRKTLNSSQLYFPSK